MLCQRKIDWNDAALWKRVVAGMIAADKGLLIKTWGIKINFNVALAGVFTERGIFTRTGNFVRFSFAQLTTVRFEHLSLSKHKRALFNQVVVLQSRYIMSLHVDVAYPFEVTANEMTA